MFQFNDDDVSKTDSNIFKVEKPISLRTSKTISSFRDCLYLFPDCYLQTYTSMDVLLMM